MVNLDRMVNKNDARRQVKNRTIGLRRSKCLHLLAGTTFRVIHQILGEHVPALHYKSCYASGDA
ncbi:MAG TPA: hypothetical protein DEF41_04340 [Desulfovibrio sp.]|uniref:Uncharacterized protein n=1 Tax=Nitratidesulfovibrio vulgaris (strain ATCC 29579 / DSM 644 / CCUG 34227 / NCIMB 8303 / VKM B-1760 / Hildenborough) TaxID=882 RepID=Q72B75_NITV2|nr:hypothetical protein DVU_1761 [Nitratidesulfovibrio vulgaris str. Hildenborough]HBW15365.1 hypothetical protein [Desulfovibrio sp.]